MPSTVATPCGQTRIVSAARKASHCETIAHVWLTGHPLERQAHQQTVAKMCSAAQLDDGAIERAQVLALHAHGVRVLREGQLQGTGRGASAMHVHAQCMLSCARSSIAMSSISPGLRRTSSPIMNASSVEACAIQGARGAATDTFGQHGACQPTHLLQEAVALDKDLHAIQVDAGLAEPLRQLVDHDVRARRGPPVKRPRKVVHPLGRGRMLLRGAVVSVQAAAGVAREHGAVRLQAASRRGCLTQHYPLPRCEKQAVASPKLFERAGWQPPLIMACNKGVAGGSRRSHAGRAGGSVCSAAGCRPR